MKTETQSLCCSSHMLIQGVHAHKCDEQSSLTAAENRNI